ncbi:hypothetical protein [Marinicellulosiphila megalodicopiae]|uniref:hypothetical protein n=1 Tax=Marinicellulosiphila megalodicopiae TaxID=2724896 RepID=UPI003BB094A6
MEIVRKNLVSFTTIEDLNIPDGMLNRTEEEKKHKICSNFHDFFDAEIMKYIKLHNLKRTFYSKFNIMSYHIRDNGSITVFFAFIIDDEQNNKNLPIVSKEAVTLKSFFNTVIDDFYKILLSLEKREHNLKSKIDCSDIETEIITKIGKKQVSKLQTYIHENTITVFNSDNEKNVITATEKKHAILYDKTKDIDSVVQKILGATFDGTRNSDCRLHLLTPQKKDLRVSKSDYKKFLTSGIEDCLLDIYYIQKSDGMCELIKFHKSSIVNEQNTIIY